LNRKDDGSVRNRTLVGKDRGFPTIRTRRQTGLSRHA